MKTTTYYESMGLFTLEIPDEAVSDCSHQGPCDDDVAFWLPKIDFSKVTREMLIDALSDTGGWSRDETKRCKRAFCGLPAAI